MAKLSPQRKLVNLMEAQARALPRAVRSLHFDAFDAENLMNLSDHEAGTIVKEILDNLKSIPRESMGDYHIHPFCIEAGDYCGDCLYEDCGAPNSRTKQIEEAIGGSLVDYFSTEAFNQFRIELEWSFA